MSYWFFLPRNSPYKPIGSRPIASDQGFLLAYLEMGRRRDNILDKLYPFGYNFIMIHIRRKLRQVIWVGNSKAELVEFPKPIQKDIGDGLFIEGAQAGSLSPAAKPLKGIGSGVFEIRADYRTNTYRAVYSMKIGNKVYVLHCFQKKSKRGIKTPQKEIDLIKRRLKIAQELEENSE